MLNTNCGALTNKNCLGCKVEIFHVHIANHFSFKIALIFICRNLSSELHYFTTELSSGKN